MATNQRSLLLGILAALFLSNFATAEQGIGIVTAIQGQAAVSRASLPQPGALHFKDDVFFRDQIATRERSTVRLLLGGKSTLTIREHSQVTLDESVTPEGAKRSIISVLSGKIGAAIAHALMRPGDAVEVRTPDAIASVRGSVLIAEYIPPTTGAAASPPILLASAAPGPLLAQTSGTGGTSNFFVLSGQVTITPQGQPPVTLGPLQAMSVTATPGGVQAGSVQNMTPAQAAQAAQGLDTPKSHTGEAEGGRTAQAQAEMAAALATSILQATNGQPAGTGQPALATGFASPPTPTVITVPVVPEVKPEGPGPGAGTGENVLPTGALISLDNITLGIGGGTSLATFSGGAPNTITPLAMSGGGTAYITTPLLTVTGNPITHSGPIVALTNSAILTGDYSGMPAPLVKITGTTVNNSGPMFDLSGGSMLTSYGPVLGTQDATLNAGSSVVSMNGAYVYSSGKILDIVNSKITVNGPVFSLRNGSVASLSGGPMIHLSGSSLTAQGDLGSSDETGNVVVISAPMLDASNSTISLGSYELPKVSPNSDMTTFSLPAGVPQINLTNSMLTSARTHSFLDFGYLGGSPVTYDGLLLTATDSTITLAESFTQCWSEDNVTSNGTAPLIQLTRSSLAVGSSLISMDGGSYLKLSGPFLDAAGLDATGAGLRISGDVIGVYHGSELYTTSTTTTPLIQLNNSSLTSGTFLNVYGLGASEASAHVDIYGPLLQGTNSPLTVTGSLVRIDLDGYLQSHIGPSASLITLTGGTHSIDGGGDGSLLQYYAGSSGLSMFWPGGTFLTADGATINLKGSGNAIKVDTASLTASAPIINLINSSTLNTSPTGDSINGAMWVKGSSASFTGSGSVFSLDKSTLNIQRGPLLSVTGGSSMTVNGDFASLANGSKITVANGPLIAADGASTVLWVKGNLLNFLTSSGNQVLINNTLGFTGYSYDGVPYKTSGGATVSFPGATPVINNLGTNTVDFLNSSTKSAISATNGAKVCVKTGSC